MSTKVMQNIFLGFESEFLDDIKIVYPFIASFYDKSTNNAIKPVLFLCVICVLNLKNKTQIDRLAPKNQRASIEI